MSLLPIFISIEQLHFCISFQTGSHCFTLFTELFKQFMLLAYFCLTWIEYHFKIVQSIYAKFRQVWDFYFLTQRIGVEEICCKNEEICCNNEEICCTMELTIMINTGSKTVSSRTMRREQEELVLKIFVATMKPLVSDINRKKFLIF